MSTPFAEAFIEIAVDNARLRQELEQSKGLFTAFITGAVAGIVTSGMDKILGIATSAVSSFFGAFSGSVAAAAEAEEVEARLNAVVMATGQAAGFTTDKLIEMANALEKTSIFGDESIKSAEGILLTFRSLKGENFERALKSTADLAAFLGTDMASAARGVGRALEDPEGGLRALKQAGVVFNDEQMKVIKNLMDTGQVAAAQTLVLDGLAGRIGGVSDAMAGTFSGLRKQLENQIGNLGEVFGRFLLPMLRPVNEFFRDMVTKAQEVEPFITGIANQLGNAVSMAMDKARGFLTDANFTSIFEILRNTGQAILNLFEKIGAVLAGPVGAGIDKAQSGFSKILDFLSTISRDFSLIWDTVTTEGFLHLQIVFLDAADIFQNAMLKAVNVIFDEAERRVKEMGRKALAIGTMGASEFLKLFDEQQKFVANIGNREEIDKLKEQLKTAQGIRQTRFEQLEAEKLLERSQNAQNDAQQQRARALSQEVTALKALSPMELLKGVITGKISASDDLKRAAGGDNRGIWSKMMGPLNQMFEQKPQQQGAGEGLWNLGQGAVNAVLGLVDMGRAVGMAKMEEIKAERQFRAASFTGLSDMHKQIQQSAAGSSLTDMTRKIVDNGKDALKKQDEGNKLLKEIAGNMGDMVAVFA